MAPASRAWVWMCGKHCLTIARLSRLPVGKSHASQHTPQDPPSVGCCCLICPDNAKASWLLPCRHRQVVNHDDIQKWFAPMMPGVIVDMKRGSVSQSERSSGSLRRAGDPAARGGLGMLACRGRKPRLGAASGLFGDGLFGAPPQWCAGCMAEGHASGRRWAWRTPARSCSSFGQSGSMQAAGRGVHGRPDPPNTRDGSAARLRMSRRARATFHAAWRRR